MYFEDIRYCLQHSILHDTASTKVRLTAAAIWQMNIWMSVNHFPYLSIVTNPENNPCIQTVIRITTEI